MSCLHRVSLVRSDLRSCLRRSPLCPGPAPLVLGFHGQPSQASNALNAAAQASKALNAPAADVKLATSSSEQDPVRGRFVIPKEEVQASMRAQGLSLEEFLMSLIKPASREAKTPISGFHVGAVGLGGSGNVYVGVNVEFRKGPLNNSIHAEQFLLVNCLRSGETTVKALAVSEAPCGHCRQFMCELVCSDTMQLLFGKDMKPKSLAGARTARQRHWRE